MSVKFKGIFFLSQLLSKPDTKNNKDAFLSDQVTYICDKKPISSKRTQKKFDVKFLILHGCYFHGRYIMTTRRRQERRLKSEFAFFQS